MDHANNAALDRAPADSLRRGPLRPTRGGGLSNASSMLGDPELLARVGARASAATQAGELRKLALHHGRCSGLVAQQFSRISRLTSSALCSIATLAAAFTAEGLDMLFAALTARIRGREHRGSPPHAQPAPADIRPLYAPDRCGADACVHECLTVDVAALLHSRTRGPAALRDVPTAAPACALISSVRTCRSPEALVATLEKSDQYTAGHSKAVAIYSRDIAERMGLSPDVQERTYLCGLVHDIGKVGLARESASEGWSAYA